MAAQKQIRGSTIKRWLFVLLLATNTNVIAQRPENEPGLKALSEATNYKDSIQELISRSYAQTNIDAYAQARAYAMLALQICRKHNDKHLQPQVYANLRGLYIAMQQHDSGLYYARKTIAAADSINQKNLNYAYALNTIGAHYLYKGDMPRALKYAHRQMDVAKEINDTVCISNACTMLAAIYQVLENNEQCLEYLKRSLELNRLSGKLYNRATVLFNLASVYVEAGRVAEAKPLLYETLEVATNNFKSSRDIGMVYLLLGNCYSVQKHFDSALIYVDKARPYFSVTGEGVFDIDLLSSYARVYAGMKKYNISLSFLDSSIALARKLGFANEVVHSLKAKAEALAGLKRYKEAYTVQLDFKALADSISNAGMKTKIAQARELYESEQKDKVIAQQQQLNKLLSREAGMQQQKLRNEVLLKNALLSENNLARQQLVKDSIIRSVLDRENETKQRQLTQTRKMNKVLAEDNKLRAADLRNERIINSLLIGGLFIVLLSGGLAFAQYRKQKMANRTIQDQSNKLTLLMKELHHRVKNNLQIISSLLSLQSFRIKDAAASKAVREGQLRIEAMSLIHQRLYTRDNISEINIREFITDLVDSLQSAYGYTDDSIDVQLDIADERMNVDQAIPLSLIINELVTNVFKYACEDNSHPELVIKLRKENDTMHLVVADNGKGINIEEWKGKEGSFGKELIQTFVKQLNGYLALAVNNGTQFRLTIPGIV